MLEKIKQYRRDLHRIPELELELPQTQNYIKTILKDLPCTLYEPIPSSVLAFFDNQKDTTIAFRADMDALPIQEETHADYQSDHPGKMHACGHDGHMAILLGLAHALKDTYHHYPVNILLIFQPGEEAPGGARLICQSNILKELKVSMIFGLHLWPQLASGTIATKPGPMMARSSEVNIDIYGRASHAAKYKEGIDAIEIGAKYLTDVYACVDSLPESTPRLLRFGKMMGGNIRNVVADHARLEGTMRALEDQTYDRLKEFLHTCAKPYPARFTFSFSEGYPPVTNDQMLVKQLKNEIPDIQILNDHEMITEDFSWYQQEIPGVFFFLGTGTGIPLHSCNFDFDEEILLKGVHLDLQILEHIKNIGR